MGAESINLSEDSRWVTFVLGGHEFQAEVFETVDLLWEIDMKHRDDPNVCLNCFAEFSVPSESFGKPAEYVCPICGARGSDGRIRFSQKYLDDVASLLRDRFGVARVSRNEAYAFYSKVIALSEELKKNPG